MIARCVGVTGLLASLLLSSASAQEKGKLDTALHASLRDVINTGADLFNIQADYAGCYRLYQGGLIAIKPMLKPEMQTDIDKALAEAAKKANFADRAHHLRAAIDSLRDQVKPATPVVPPPPLLKAPTTSRVDGELIRVPPTKIKP